MTLFTKNKKYSMDEIIKICDENKMITVDCLKDENMISVEFESQECLFEFMRIDDDVFELTWKETNF